MRRCLVRRCVSGSWRLRPRPLGNGLRVGRRRRLRQRRRRRLRLRRHGPNLRLLLKSCRPCVVVRQRRRHLRWRGSCRRVGWLGDVVVGVPGRRIHGLDGVIRGCSGCRTRHGGGSGRRRGLRWRVLLGWDSGRILRLGEGHSRNRRWGRRVRQGRRDRRQRCRRGIGVRVSGKRLHGLLERSGQGGDYILDWGRR